jgi:hypothetical protein
VNNSTNVLCGFSRKGCLAAPLADQAGDMFHKDVTALNGEHFAYKFFF